MTKKELDQLKFPIGHFKKPETIDHETTTAWIDDIAVLPEKLNRLTQNMSKEQLETAYRPGGWTVQQVVHHLADSHMNSFIRFKLALTENTPTIRPYFENRWAEQVDYLDTPIALSISLLTALHARWVILLRSLSEGDLNKTFIHPESNHTFSLKENIGIYAWHGNHHLAHIQSLGFD